MAYLDWPAGVPFRPDPDSWGVTPFRPPLETGMQGGNVRVRRRPGDRLATMRWGKLLLPAEVAAFMAFIASIGNGTQRFWMPVCLNGATYEIRLVQITGGIPDYASPGGATLMASLTLLVFPAEMTPALPSITSIDPVIAGTATPGATVQLDIGGVSRSVVATFGTFSVDVPFLEDGRYMIRARYPGGPWSVPVDFTMPNPLKTTLRALLLGSASGLVLDLAGTQGGLILAPAAPASQYLGPAMGATVFSRASTATYYDKDGILRTAAANVPRLDYDPITKALKGLRLEGASTNLAYVSASNNSETMASGSFNLSVNKSYPAPDGTNNATLVTETAVNSEHYAGDIAVSAVADDLYVFSAYVKAGPAGSPRHVRLRAAASSETWVMFNPTTGVWSGAASANVVSRGYDVLLDGWFRIWMCVYIPATATKYFRVHTDTGYPGGPYLGDGASGILVWGRQLEKVTAARGPSSYIPALTGVTTRAADSCYLNTAGWLNDAEGSIFIDYTSEAGNDLISFALMRTDTNGGLAQGSIYQQTSTSANTVLSIRSYKDGASQPVISVGTNVAFSERCRVAASFKTGALRGCRNAGLVAGTAGFPMPTGLERLWIGNRSGLGNPLFGWVSGLKYFPTALSDAQLQALTA